MCLKKLLFNFVDLNMNNLIIIFFLTFSGVLYGQECLGGELRTIDSYLYGRFEVNMKSVQGDGYVSSFFTYHDHWGDSDPDEWSLLTNEIDIEMTGNLNESIQFTTHHPGEPNSWSYGEIVSVGFNPHLDFHDYEFEWTSKKKRSKQNIEKNTEHDDINWEKITNTTRYKTNIVSVDKNIIYYFTQIKLDYLIIFIREIL